MTDATCSIPDCDSPTLARGWCRLHYRRWHTHGDPLIVLTHATGRWKTNRADERFAASVTKTDPCWLWTGRIDDDGYGVFHDHGPQGAHRWSYERRFGPVPIGMQLDHLCRVRHCVRPDHLEPVVQRVNILRGQAPTAVNARKTECLRGHEFSSANTYINPRGSRECRTCRRERWRRKRGDLR